MTGFAAPPRGSCSAAFTIGRGTIDQSVTLPARGFDLLVDLIQYVPAADAEKDTVLAFRYLMLSLTINGTEFIRWPMQAFKILGGQIARFGATGAVKTLMIRDDDTVALRLLTPAGRRVWPNRKVQISVGIAGTVCNHLTT